MLTHATQLSTLLTKHIGNTQEDLPMKNLFAIIGFAVVVKKGYDLYCEYRELKHEKEADRSPAP